MSNMYGNQVATGTVPLATCCQRDGSSGNLATGTLPRGRFSWQPGSAKGGSGMILPFNTGLWLAITNQCG